LSIPSCYCGVLSTTFVVCKSLEVRSGNDNNKTERQNKGTNNQRLNFEREEMEMEEWFD
jgi:hypothetical protein